MEQSEQDVDSNLPILRAIQKDESSREQSKETKESKDESLRLNVVDKGGCSSTTSEEFHLSVEDDEFYHGLLPKEDLPFLLREVGDFVTRTTQTSGPDVRRVLVISVKTSSGKGQTSFRHIVIRVKKVDGACEWKPFENIKFNSLKELIDAYITSKRPLIPDVKESALIRGIKKQPWEFRNNEVRLKGVIGTGQFGDVRAGEVYIRGKLKKVAVKLGKEDGSGRLLSGEQIREMMHEARLMRYFKHENVLKTYGVAVFKEPIMIILELVKGGCILDVLHQRRGHISQAEKVKYMCLGTAQGLAYLHEHKCIHRDIAARNVLYTHDKVAKISDFGLSRIGDCCVVKRSKRIPLRWTAPESFTAFKFTAKSDVFAFAIFMWEVLSDGEEPYKHKTNIEVRRMVEKGKRLEKPKQCSNETFSIVEKCWAPDPDNRCSMKEAVQLLSEVNVKPEKDSRTSSDVDGTGSEDVVRCASLKSYKSSKRLRRKRILKRPVGNRMDLCDAGSGAQHPRLMNMSSIKIIRRNKANVIRKAAATDQSINSKDDSREGTVLSKDKSVESREKSSESKENLDDDRKRRARLSSA
uniref:Tyrosine-protein kinase n=2 Tax=Parascaris univalens TaxID=6257 RepID=A0A915AMV1_PARUN